MKKWAFDGPLMSFAFDRGGVVGSEKNIFWIDLCPHTSDLAFQIEAPRGVRGPVQGSRK